MFKKLFILTIFFLAFQAEAQSTLVQGAPAVVYFGTDPTVRQPCRVPSYFIKTDAASGLRNYACEGTTFVLQGDGGGAGSNVQINGIVVASPDFVSDADIQLITCTGAGAPDAACVSTDDIVLRIKSNSINLNTDTSTFWAAGDAVGGNALAGDSATDFFNVGTINDARIDGSVEKDEIVNGTANTYVLFNDGGSLNGVATLTYNKTTGVLTVGDGVTQGILDVKCPTPGSMDCSQTHVEDTTTATPSAGNRKLQARSDGFYERDSSAAEGRFISTRPNSTTSADLAGGITNESGTGLAVFNNTPTISNLQLSDYIEGTEAAAPGAPAAGKVRLYAKSGATGVFCSKDDAGVETCMGGSSSASVRYVSFLGAGCNITSSGPGFNIPTTNGPVSTCYGTDPWRFGGLDYANGANALNANALVRLSGWDAGTITLDLIWFCVDGGGTCTTNNVVWEVQTKCLADTELIDNPTFNAVEQITTAGSATDYARITSSDAGLDITGCAANETLLLKVARDPTEASDTQTGTAVLVEAVVKYGTL